MVQTPEPTEQIFSTDAYCREFDATVLAVRDGAVILDRTAFYPGGGGQPCDTGVLTWPGGTARVTEAKRQGDLVLHVVQGDTPPVGARVHGALDWDRRYALMRHHTALHVLCGVIYQLFGATVTGGQMYPDRARMDFALPDLTPERLDLIVRTANERLAEDRPIRVFFLPRAEALKIPDLIRTKANLVPESVQTFRIVDIEGIDLQADGGTHVARTGEVGRIRISRTENKGRENKRIEIVLE